MTNETQGGAAVQLSVSIVVFHSEIDELLDNLDSLSAAVKALSGDTLVEILDNSIDMPYSADLARALTSREPHWHFTLRYREMDDNLGYGRANNIAIAETNASYHLILNPDVHLRPDSLVLAVNHLEENSDCVLVTPRILHQGEKTHVAKRFPNVLTLALRAFRGRWQPAMFRKRLDTYTCAHLGETLSEVDIAGGCFMLVRSGEIKQVGGFDEDFFMYFEDFDLSLRLRELGRIDFLPSVVIQHEGGGVGGKDWRHQWYFARSAVTFFNRHGWQLI